MPKQKTKRGAAKRLKRTATGRIKAKRAGTGHLMSSKSTKRKRGLRGMGMLSDVEAKRYRHLIP